MLHSDSNLCALKHPEEINPETLVRASDQVRDKQRKDKKRERDLIT